MTRRFRQSVGVAMALLVGGCASGSDGSDAPVNGQRSSRLVDLAAKPPLVNALDIDPGDGDFLLTTNRGFFRIDPRTKAVERVRGTVNADGASSPVGTFSWSS